MSRARYLVGERAELTRDVVIAIDLARGADGRPREALVLLADDGTPRAYLNRCRHLPVPLDGGTGQFLTRGGDYLICGTHGALYRRDDGVCTAGPCLKLALEPFEIEEEDGRLYLLD